MVSFGGFSEALFADVMKRLSAVSTIATSQFHVHSGNSAEAQTAGRDALGYREGCLLMRRSGGEGGKPLVRESLTRRGGKLSDSEDESGLMSSRGPTFGYRAEAGGCCRCELSRRWRRFGSPY